MIDLNATQAPIRAGYSELTADVQGPRLLGNVVLPLPSQPSKQRHRTASPTREHRCH
ncbi:terminase small subunit [Mesorhizobium sp. M1066]